MKNLSCFAALLLGQVLHANALPNHDGASQNLPTPVLKRDASPTSQIINLQTSPSTERGDRQLNASQTQCNMYLGTGHNNEDLAVCYPFCGGISTHPSAGFSVTCLAAAGPGQDIPTYEDKNGNKYQVGGSYSYLASSIPVPFSIDYPSFFLLCSLRLYSLSL